MIQVVERLIKLYKLFQTLDLKGAYFLFLWQRKTAIKLKRLGNSKGGRQVTLLSALGKLPPQAIDFKEAVLGALMLEKDALTAVG